MPVRQSTAEWKGGLKDGKGTMALGSGAYNGPYSFDSRFESGTGTNPEELIAAAHAGCFSMAFSKMLGDANFRPDFVKTKANVTFEKKGEGFSITKSHLDMEAKIPGIDKAKFTEIAEKAKSGCPVSRVLAGAEITLNAKLV